MTVEKIPYVENLVDPSSNTLMGKIFDGHKDNISFN